MTATGSRPVAAAGLILLAGDGSIATTDAAGAAWLAQLGADDSTGQLPEAVARVVRRAARAAAGESPAPVRARVKTRSGRWVVVRGSALSGIGEARIAVTVEPMSAHDHAPVAADAYGLTEREREVTQLVAQGLATDAIAGRLYISRWTVQDHLKVIFEKVGVSTRGELVARVFFGHDAPELAGLRLEATSRS